MKRPLSSRFIAAAVLAAAAFGAASAAQAHTDVQLSIGLPGLPVFVRPPVYVEPAPVYAPPAVVYERPRWSSYGDARRDEWQRREWQRREWERREWHHREWERHHDRSGWDGRGRD